jgi:xylulokinase
MALVAGVDSSTQSCKVVIHDLETGALVRHGRGPHPDSTEVDPDIWWSALGQAIEAAGGIGDVHGIAIAAQQHGMLCLDEIGNVVRPAMLWNDPRPARGASELVAEWGAGSRVDWNGSAPSGSYLSHSIQWPGCDGLLSMREQMRTVRLQCAFLTTGSPADCSAHARSTRW